MIDPLTDLGTDAPDGSSLRNLRTVPTRRGNRPDRPAYRPALRAKKIFPTTTRYPPATEKGECDFFTLPSIFSIGDPGAIRTLDTRLRNADLLRKPYNRSRGRYTMNAAGKAGSILHPVSLEHLPAQTAPDSVLLPGHRSFFNLRAIRFPWSSVRVQMKPPFH